MGGLPGLTTVVIWICGSFMLLCVLVAIITKQQAYWNRAKWFAVVVVCAGLIALLNDALLQS